MEHFPHEIRMTRMFTNQVDGMQSVAFYHPVVLRDSEDGKERRAVVMYVIPVSEFDDNFQINNSSLKSVESVIVTINGDYISKNGQFKNSNVFEFFNSYNHYSEQQLETLKETMSKGHGTFDAKNAYDELVHVAYASNGDENGFIVISMLRDSDMLVEKTDFMLTATIGIGLMVFFCFNIIIVMSINKSLAQAVKAEKKASLAKTEFLSTMSHDIRTPLNAILGFTAIARQQKDDHEAVQENLDKIAMAGDHLLMLINDILDISQIENHSIKLEPHVVSLQEMMMVLRNIAEPIAREKNLHFELVVEDLPKPYVLVDRLRLNQIYVNIVGNALKYTNSGTVKVQLKELPGKTPDDVTLQVIVADTGVGIAPEFIPKIYNSFVREDDRRTSNVGGTGLGLAITKHLVDLMGGTISCESELGKGSVFTVTIQVPAAAAPDERIEEKPAAQTEGLRVLVAEDNKMNWEIASAMLEMEGMNAFWAKNGQEAVDMLRANPKQYDLVLMDLRMPVMGGLEAARVIRADENPAIQNIPIIAVSADAFSENITQCLEAGMNAHIGKPIDCDELMMIIGKMKGGI